MFPEYDAYSARALSRETIDGKFRREYYEARETPKPAARSEHQDFYVPGPNMTREAALVKIARFIRLA
jgi:hypothetical protein